MSAQAYSARSITNVFEHWGMACCIILAGWMGSLRCCFCSSAGHLAATLRLEQPHSEPHTGTSCMPCVHRGGPSVGRS